MLIFPKRHIPGNAIPEQHVSQDRFAVTAATGGRGICRLNFGERLKRRGF
jgi:hypothetical protein